LQEQKTAEVKVTVALVYKQLTVTISAQAFLCTCVHFVPVLTSAWLCEY